MKKRNIIIILAIISMVGCGKNNEYKPSQISQSIQALEKHTLDKNVKWSGIVLQSIKNKTNTCFQIIEAENDANLKPKYKILNNDSRFIVCQNILLDVKKYDRRLVTVTGDIVSFKKVSSNNSEFPIVNASSIEVLKTPNMNDSQYQAYWSKLMRNNTELRSLNDMKARSTNGTPVNN